MCKVQILRALVEQRLSAAAEEIFGLFERTIAEYEEELCRSKEENERQQKILDAVLQPEVRLHRAEFSADVQQLPVRKEEVPPEQQDWSSSLDQEDPKPPNIKEEQEEVWTSQEGGQSQCLEEADITKFPFTPVPVKSEDDEEEPQSSQLHQRHTEQMETGADGEDCGGPEPDRNSDPDRHVQPDTEDQNEDSSEPETEDSEDWKETRELQSSQLHQRHTEQTETGADGEDCGGPEPDPKRHSQPQTDDRISESLKSVVGYSSGEKPFNCSECGRRFRHKGHLLIHLRCHTGEKPFGCSICGKRFPRKENLVRHMRFHSGEKPFSCLFCTKHFTRSDHAVAHMRIHTGEKPFSCSVCAKSFTHKPSLKNHMSLHTEERLFSCSVCDRRFTRQALVRGHKCVSGSRGDETPEQQEEQLMCGGSCGHV